MFAIFAIFIALPWIVLNFLSKRRDSAVKAAGDPGMNASLSALADKLEHRLDAIETILDHEVPGWRRDVNRRSA
jgi:phage shock protein B